MLGFIREWREEFMQQFGCCGPRSGKEAQMQWGAGAPWWMKRQTTDGLTDIDSSSQGSMEDTLSAVSALLVADAIDTALMPTTGELALLVTKDAIEDALEGMAEMVASRIAAEAIDEALRRPMEEEVAASITAASIADAFATAYRR